MPDNVMNEVLLHNVKLRDCAKHLFNQKGALSFEVLVPLPIYFWRGGCGSKLREVFVGDAMDAACAMWGTKWDAYGVPFTGDVPDGTLLQFQTAWNPPRGWLCALFNTLGCDITSSWLSESERFVHVETYKQTSVWDTPTWDEAVLGQDSAEYLHLYALLNDGLAPPDEDEGWGQDEGDTVGDGDDIALDRALP